MTIETMEGETVDVVMEKKEEDYSKDILFTEGRKSDTKKEMQQDTPSDSVAPPLSSMHTDLETVTSTHSAVEDLETVDEIDKDNDNKNSNQIKTVIIDGSSQTTETLGSEESTEEEEETIAAAATTATTKEPRTTGEAFGPEKSPNEHTEITTTTTTTQNLQSQKAQKQKETAAPEKHALLTLPVDSLHQVASFLTPSEWLRFAQSSRTSSQVFREVIRRVRLHGFKNATEVVTAWKLGRHSDAKELVALYIQSGVPIYPRSLGHSYHTLLWRMQVEAREITNQQQQVQQQQQQTPQNQKSSCQNKMDQFYSNRLEFRVAQDYTPDLTYVEEKCLYWTMQAIQAGKLKKPAVRGNPMNRMDASPGRLTSTLPSPLADTDSEMADRIPVRVHQHLLDQHIRRKYCVNDSDGLMITPGISLSADFYHPSWYAEAVREQEENTCETHLPLDLRSIPENLESLASEDTTVTDELIPAPQAPNNRVVEPRDDVDDLLMAQDMAHTERRRPPPPSKLLQALRSCEVEPYTASQETSLTIDEADGSQELRKHLRSRFATYQRRLDIFLAQTNNSGFEECMLDFWDEFFPHTAYIQYYDMHTPVPRVSCLHKFLTRPCPKAIGIVQCEIERIKITSRGKGVSMKGRLFPTYEYRLFIRHRPHNQAPESALAGEEDDGFDRRDTVLMVAKNRGRKHTEVAGVGSTKKGSNNYFLYMPQQMDVDAHYNKVNDLREPSKMNANGASLDPVIVSEDSSSVLMGRLQSNFIGTEFQIFTPRQKKQRRKGESMVARTVYSPSDDEVDYDSSVSSDNNTSNSNANAGAFSRRSRLGMFRLGSTHGLSDSSELLAHRTRARSMPRSMSPSSPSQPDASNRRPNRRAIANAEGMAPAPSTIMTEEEDGVITYTANLLGSRPRIMDVCIPKVTSDGVAGGDWRRYLESMEEPEEGRMLHCFRQLLQRLENLDPQQPRVDGGDGAQEPHHHGDESSTNPLSSSSPSPGGSGEDFGLVPLQNRPPWWNVELGSFVLNFGGRVSVASVKNFQLCDRTDQDNIMLQFGRIHGRHSFTMDFQYPLTAVQAFSIAISSLQSKISFG